MWTQFQAVFLFFDYITVFVVAHLFTYMCAAQLIIAHNCCVVTFFCAEHTRAELFFILKHDQRNFCKSIYERN